ncbi:methyl-accepting chemotaxis protein [Pseudanabaena sp. FACHB-1998]|uniref:methyl-accepting chemotaxis protein n=1 Tax=Pseudanabaena sp. FACHB-1998 TaxID=2692858 RepID=UPI0016806BB2|nr:methyl-accepting chemotaxis protein [Pseudanabaena sp. FACHB-1998]MBD2178146.1 methyl-accepting chemotaxis protein [Pseudanabaena sp. FACHB-1998]
MASKSNKTPEPSLGKSSKPSPKRSPKSSSAPKQNKPKGTMGLGLLLIAIGTSLIGLGGLGYFVYQELLSNAKREVDQSAESKTRQFDSKLANVRQTVVEVANSAKTLAASKPKPEVYQKLAAEGLQRNESIAGLGIAQNENQLFATPKPLFPYIWKEGVGLKVEGSSQKLPAPNDKLLSGNRPDIPNTASFKTAIKGKAAWSEPYSAVGKNIITYSAPIGDGQKILGVVNADAIADNLLALVDTATNPDSSSESKIGLVIVSGGGKVITASNKFQATQAQNPAIAESLNTLAQQAKAQPSGIAQTGGNLWAYRKLDGSDLIVAAYLPEAEIINKVMILVGGTALGISAILAIAVLGFVNSLKTRLKPITEECDRFLAQHGTSANLGGKDEIEQLSLSLKSTLQQVKTQEIKLRSELKQADINEEPTASQNSSAENDLMEAEVGDLLDVVSSMEEGDLTIEAQVNDRATGLVADTLNRLREKLVEIISSVLGTAQQVAKGAADLEELARTVVLNTAEQAQSVAQGQALTEQVATIAQRSAEQVNVANESLQEVRETVASGQSAINNLTEGISVLQSGSAQIVQRMKTLGEFVGLAEQFVQDQGQIASLTQVLALNATLVAARAAEQKDPKQFTSVAREFESIAGQVNDLATQTNDGLTILQQRTSQIQTVVTAIDAEVQNLSGLVSGFTTGVEASQSAFNSIQMATEEVVQIGQAITDSSTEIAEAAGSTASYISEIAQLADRTADLTRSARQQAEDMGNQAQQLVQGIQFFRLPESALANSLAATTASEPYDSVESDPVQNFLSPEPESSTEDSNGLGLVLPAIAVTTAAVAVSQSLSNEPESEPESEFESNYAIDSLELDMPNLDDESGELSQQFVQIEADSPSLDADFAAYHDETIAPESFISESSDHFSEIPEEQDINAYSELTDISVIERSLLDDLRQEVYAEDEFLDEESLDTDESSEEDISALKNPMEGVDESAINGVSNDPMIISATSSFLEDTAFGTPSPLSDETLAHLPTSVDFSIPDMDDGEDFTMPSIEMESTLDNSNSFFTSDLVNPLESGYESTDLEDAFGIDPQLEQAVNLIDYSNEAVFNSDYPDMGMAEIADLNSLEESSSSDLDFDYGDYAETNADTASTDLDLDYDYAATDSFEESADLNIDYADYSGTVTAGELDSSYGSYFEESTDTSVDNQEANVFSDYNDYVADSELNDSLETTSENVPNEAFIDSFDTSFDESPFDKALDEALNNYPDSTAIEDSLESFPNSESIEAELSDAPVTQESYSTFDLDLSSGDGSEDLDEFDEFDDFVDSDSFLGSSTEDDFDTSSTSAESPSSEFFLELETSLSMEDLEPEDLANLAPASSEPQGVEDFTFSIDEDTQDADSFISELDGLDSLDLDQEVAEASMVTEAIATETPSNDLDHLPELDMDEAIADFSIGDDTAFGLSDLSQVQETDAGNIDEVFSFDTSFEAADEFESFSSLDNSQTEPANILNDLDELATEAPSYNETFADPFTDDLPSFANSLDDEPEASSDLSFTESLDLIEEIGSESSDELDGFAEGLKPDLGLMDFSETNFQTSEDDSFSSSVSTANSLDFDETSIFDNLADDMSEGLDDLNFGSPESLDTLKSPRDVAPQEIDPEEMSLDTDLGLDFSTNWLEELSSMDETTDDFANDTLESLDTPSLVDISTTPVSAPSYDFTNDLLDSLIDESDDDFTASPMSLDELTPDETNAPFVLDSANVESLDLSQDNTPLDFDFDAFEESISDLNDPFSQSVGQSVASAKEEIDNFLSSSFDLDSVVEEKPQTPAKPKVPPKTDESP